MVTNETVEMNFLADEMSEVIKANRKFEIAEENSIQAFRTMLAHLWVYSRKVYDVEDNQRQAYEAWNRKRGLKYKTAAGKLIDDNKYLPVVKFLFGTGVASTKKDGTPVKKDGKQVYTLAIDKNKYRYAKVMRFLAEGNEAFKAKMLEEDSAFEKVGATFEDAMAAFGVMTPSDMMVADTKNHFVKDVTKYDEKVGSVTKQYADDNIGVVETGKAVENVAAGFGLFICKVEDGKITVCDSVSLADDQKEHEFKLKEFVSRLYVEVESDPAADEMNSLIAQTRKAA
jgi:hypothetical protein